jgi:gas vesicle protein
MRERAQAVQPEENVEQNGILKWFLAGAGIGIVFGMLYAPRSGREARNALSGTGRELRDRSRDFYERGRQLVDDASDLFERGRRLASGGLE